MKVTILQITFRTASHCIPKKTAPAEGRVGDRARPLWEGSEVTQQCRWAGQEQK